MSGIADFLRRADQRSAGRIASLDDARRRARWRLPSVVFDYVDGAADDEHTMRRNRAAFDAVGFRPTMATGLIDPEIGVTVLGQELATPVMLAPCGLVRLMHPDGAAGAARAAARRGTVSVLSTVAGSSIESVVRDAAVPFWFQLYSSGGLPEADALCARAADAGVRVLVVTVDTPTLGNRERDVRHGVAPPLRIDSRNAVPLGAEVLLRPRWAAQLAATGLRMSRRGAGPTDHGSGMLTGVSSPFTWSDVVHLRARWEGHLVVKGVLTGDDARRAVDAGADGVIVSNHGGRQLEGAPATFEALPEVAEAVGGYAEVLMDGGVRRGTHVAKALALGARAVLIGRPYLYGLSVAGEAGVARVLELLEIELRRTLVLLGCPSTKELGPQWLSTTPAGGPSA